AAMAYARALELEPAGARGYTNLGVACERLGRYQFAVEIYEHGTSSTLPDAGLLGNYAMLLYRAGQRERAHEVARAAAALDPNRPQVAAVLAAVSGEAITSGPLAAELSQPLNDLRFGVARPLADLLAAVRAAAGSGS
ncbi:MAG: hypothetical protein N2111_01115, partial [Candidatus Sumerlaeaceae bacterium]|nr:hypothetical protein [Candidatus Sumerlaeaceae bacterium]